MFVSSVKSPQLLAARKSVGNGDGRGCESDLSVFDLRDTLSNIIVRETSFSEFLSALKQCGLHAARQ